MAIPFLNNINLTDNQLQNAKLHVVNPAPTAATGQIYFDSSENVAKYHNGTTWVDFPRKFSVGGTDLAYSQSIDLVAGTNVSISESSGTITINSTDEFTGTVTSVGTSNSTFISGSGGPITTSGSLTFSLSATGTPDATTYLRGDNTWSAISGIYAWTISDGTNSEVIVNGDTVTFADSGTTTTSYDSGTNTLTISSADEFTGTVTSITAGNGLTGGTITTSGTIDLDYRGNNNYILDNPNGSATAASDDSISFNDLTDSDVKNTTLGTIPVNALTLVKQYIDDSVAGGLVYQGGYDASTNTPDLTTSPNSIEKGWTYTVTADGTFFGEQLRVGDVLIAEINNPTSLDDWTTVQNNVDLASLTQVGIGNVNAATTAPLKGLSVTYSNGTATAGLDIVGLTTQAPANNALAFIPFYDQQAGVNLKIGLSTLAGDINEFTSKAFTISDTDTITHGYNTRDVIVQLYDTETYETVYADVDRTLPNQVTITFAATPTNSIRVLVQKIG